MPCHATPRKDVLEELDPSIEPVLSKAIIKQGNREVVRLGDKELDWSHDFRLYITTKLGNPHYTPEVGVNQIHPGTTVLVHGNRCKAHESPLPPVPVPLSSTEIQYGLNRSHGFDAFRSSVFSRMQECEFRYIPQSEAAPSLSCLTVWM